MDILKQSRNKSSKRGKFENNHLSFLNIPVQSFQWQENCNWNTWTLQFPQENFLRAKSHLTMAFYQHCASESGFLFKGQCLMEPLCNTLNETSSTI